MGRSLPFVLVIGLDGIFDSYLARGVRPYVEIGFMPQALSTNPEPYRHDWRPGLPYARVYTGWRTWTGTCASR